MISAHLLRSALLGAVLAAFAAGPVTAAVLFSDNFSSPDGTLLSATTGWTRILGTPDEPVTVNGGKLRLQSPSTGGVERDYTDLGQDYSTGSLYVGFDFAVTDLPASNNTLGFFALNTTGVSVNTVGLSFNIGVGDATGYKLGLALGTSTGSVTPTSVYSAANYALNTTNRIVIEYNFVEGVLNNTANLYLNGTVVASAVYGTTGAELASLRYFAFRQPTTAQSAAVAFDDFVIATSYNEAATFSSAIPEPASAAALLGIAALGLVAARRRRRVA